MRRLILLAFVAAWMGCSADPDSGPNRSGGTAGGPDAFGNAPTPAAGDPAATGFGNTDATAPGAGTAGAAAMSPVPRGDDSCGGDAYEAVGKPLDIYIIMDESLSMIVPFDLWAPVTQALNQFFTSPDTTGISVGINFFAGICEEATYMAPAVPIAELPGNSQPLSDMLASRVAAIGTATTPALSGALAYARERQTMMPERKVVVLLVTDGEPASCGSTVQTTADAAAAALNASPAIPTYVLGLGNVGGLDQMAAAGGTGNAFVVSDPMSIQGVVDAMNSIRSSALPCEYQLPTSSGAFDKGLVNLDWTLTGTLTRVPFVGDSASCDADLGGWFYDSDEAPSQLVACEKTCADFKQGGNVNVVLGCPQQVLE